MAKVGKKFAKAKEAVAVKPHYALPEAVEAVLFLLSGASYTTGDVLRLDGGRALG